MSRSCRARRTTAALTRRARRAFTLDPPAAAAEAVPAVVAYPPPPEAAGADAVAALPADAYPPPPVVAAGGAALPSRLDLGDAELATVLSFEYAASGGLLVAAKRADFALWVDLLAAAHPVAACRAGAGALAAALPEAWPAGKDAPARLARFRPCGVGRPRPAWGACAGSAPGLRGYSCGLWTLIHALAARAEPLHGGGLWLGGVRAFVGSFFTCTDCSKHFMARTAAADVAALRGGRGAPARLAALTAWRVHNEVNARLAGEEAANGGGDPAAPKQPWPPAALCADCACVAPAGCERTWPGAPGGALWDEAAVERFLASYYGPIAGEDDDDAADPFGLGRGASSGAKSGAKTTRGGAKTTTAGGKRSGRALDAQDEEAETLVMHAAPGGLRPLTFIALCAAAPVGAYLAYVVASARAQAGLHPGPRLPGGARLPGGVKPSRPMLLRLLRRVWKLLTRRSRGGAVSGRSAKEVRCACAFWRSVGMRVAGHTPAQPSLQVGMAPPGAARGTHSKRGAIAAPRVRRQARRKHVARQPRGPHTAHTSARLGCSRAWFRGACVCAAGCDALSLRRAAQV